jgi:UDP-N-acetyl-D-glucosamine dehydrogenase
MKVAVLGLGYVGLPLAALCAIKGHDIIGFDINKDIVEGLNLGKSHVKDHNVERLFEKSLSTGRLKITDNDQLIEDCSIYLICVPTPIDESQNPDLKPLNSCVRTVASKLKKGDLIVVESTVFPGTCEEEVIPKLQKISGMEEGHDFFVAHCPERVNPGDPFWGTENIPRVIGSNSIEGTEKAANFYKSILGGEKYDVKTLKSTWGAKYSETPEGGFQVAHASMGSITMMQSIRDAEAVKAMENTVRDVNIAFVNELAKISDVLDLDVVDIINGMATKPFGKGPFYPGIGVGGHCIAVDPEWLKAASKRAGYMPELIQLARTTNNSMPEYAVKVLQDLLNECYLPLKGTKVLIVGVAYKKNINDCRESPYFEVKDLLIKKGCLVEVYDSWIPTENTVGSLEIGLQKASAVVIVTDHDDLIDVLANFNYETSPVKAILDGRNCLNAEDISSYGLKYAGIGRN